MAAKSEAPNSHQWIVVGPDCCLNESNLQHISKIKHPKTGEGAMFMINTDKKIVYEINRFDEGYRSWFLGNYVQQDGTISMMTPIDPIFLVLPYLINSAQDNRAVPLEDLLTDAQFPDIFKIKDCCTIDQLSLVADKKGTDDLVAFKYNKDKTMTWLKTKVVRLAEKLEKRHFNVKTAQSDVYIKTMKETVDKDSYIHYSHGLVADYLPEDLSQQLKDYMGIKDPELDVTQQTSGSEENEGPPTKKLKLDKENGPSEDYTQKSTSSAKKATTKQTKAQKMLGSVDKKGMKSITNFFTKK